MSALPGVSNPRKPVGEGGPAALSRDWFAWLVSLAVLLSRIFTTATPYFSDTWRHLRAIHDRTYIIQPPGYWLFNRLGALFPDAALGLNIINWTCSTAGVAVFYACALRVLPDRRTARWATALYASIFYVWFSGSEHTTRATQLLFPVLIYYLLLRAQESSLGKYLYWAAIAMAIGAGFRPTDGIFMTPLFLWRLFRWPSRRESVLALALAAVMCCGWLIPTAVAFARFGNTLNVPATDTVTLPVVGRNYVSTIMAQRSILAHGFTRETLANATRVVVALGFAFWPIVLAGFFGRDPLWDRRKLDLWIWVLPGTLFFILIYFAHATYLNFCTAGLVLLGFLQMRRLRSGLPTAAAALCIAFNIGFFTFYTPITSRSLAVNVVNVYAGKFTLFDLRYGIDVLLADVQKDPSTVQPRTRLPGSRWSYIWYRTLGRPAPE